MALSVVRRVMVVLSRFQSFHIVWALLQTLLRILRITASFVLLPLDNAILLATYFSGLLLRYRSTAYRRRQSIIRDAHFHPRTILVTGVNSGHGLAVARLWYNEGHRVIGADGTDFPIWSGESMSNALAAFYDIAKVGYVSRLVDIVHREKVDLWIPCSERVVPMDDAVAKQVIESRTRCRCIQLDPELMSMFGSPQSFEQYLVEKQLPVVENHRVQSRDSIHKILHRSPSKSYSLRRVDRVGQRPNRAVGLPKRTLSLTYNEVSEIQINRDNPWVLQQETRLGQFFAELLVVRGYVKAIKVCPVNQSSWGASRLDKGLANAIHRLMDCFARKSGSRLTGHLCVSVMVDEEFDANSVRHVLHITGCTQGAGAVKTLLADPSPALVAGYLAILSPTITEMPEELSESAYNQVETTIATTPSSASPASTIINNMSLLSAAVWKLEELSWEASRLPFWKDQRFTYLDPLPWWWNAHVYAPFRELGAILKRT